MSMTISVSKLFDFLKLDLLEEIRFPGSASNLMAFVGLIPSDLNALF